MASVSNDPEGRRLLFVFAGKRRCVRLGPVTAKVADGVKVRVERLVASLAANLPLDGETSAWLAGIGDDLAGKLAASGLIPAREKRQTVTLAGFLDGYLDKRAGEKPNTVKNLKQARKNLVGHFGDAQLLATVTPGMADDWLLWLRGEGFARASIGRCVKYARQFGRAAVRAGAIDANPFADLKAPGESNDARAYFVDGSTSLRVLAACPDDRWRLIFALCRWGGLRCPSELQTLAWEDVDAKAGRFLVRSPKTEHHEDGGERWVPVFPELRPYLERGGSGPVLPGLDSSANLRTQLCRIVRRAGLKPWPKPFQNLRSTRETELAATYPLHVVCAWIGNTARVAAGHYLQVTDLDFKRAAQIPAQQGAAPAGTEQQDQRETLGIDGVYCKKGHEEYARQESNQSAQVVSGMGLRILPFPAGAESGALARLCAIWPFLPESVRTAVLALAERQAAA
jgi:integrase